jgi:hypothetical protein
MRYTRTKAQALELEANSILLAVVFRPVMSEESKNLGICRYMYV